MAKRYGWRASIREDSRDSRPEMPSSPTAYMLGAIALAMEAGEK